MAPDHPMLEHRHLYWKYWQPRTGWQGSRSYILSGDDRIIAHAAVAPAIYAWGNSRLNVLHVIDWAARPETRGAGSTLMQHIGTLCDAILASSGSDLAWPLLPLLGFTESNTVVTLYARPIRPLEYLTGAQVPRWRLAARCVRSVFWALRAPSAAPRSHQARALAADALAAAPLPWPAPKSGTAVLERSADVMSYWLQCPVARMELYAVENSSDVEGYFMLAFVPGQARLADCWLDRDAPAEWEALVHLAVRQAARHPDVAEVVATCSEPLLAGALQRCGFHARGSRPLLVRPRNGVQLPVAGIRIQMLDDDAAYLHSGSRSFWA